MGKYKYAIWITIISAIIIGVMTFIIYNLNKTAPSKESKEQNIQVNQMNMQYLNTNQQEKNETIKTSSIEETKISPNAIIIFNKYYKECQHTITKREDITNDMVNLTKSEFQKLYSDWKITSFENNKIELYKEFDGECGEHYLVKENNGYISIYKTDLSGNITLIKNTEISTNCLPDVDIEKLKSGVSLIGKEELNSYLENFE